MSSTPEPQGAIPRPTLFVMVGLPASGKTVRAKELADAWQALRLTPDEWMIPLFGEPEGGKREILEGRFIWVAIHALRLGINVVLDFGVWTKDESRPSAFWPTRLERRANWSTWRSTSGNSDDAMRGGSRPHRRRPSRSATMTYGISVQQFEPPDQGELLSSDVGPPPAGHLTWSAWISERWPTSIP